ncbi:MAG: ShlB/FhaC/HecB family hemolysin secretion/activation protein [Pseudomonadota bacterium]
MKLRLLASCLLLGLALGVHPVGAQDEKFDIFRFEVQGNTLLPQGQVEALVAPFTGKGRVYGDIQKALEALESAYRARGYGTVNVHVPEQEITSGVVRLTVTEAVLGKVAITSNGYFDENNIRASLPNLKEGAAPNLRQISENVQLVNENPAKQVEVTLGASEEEGKVDAKVTLTEQNPKRYIVTFDNSGTLTTGRHRLGLAYQDANLMGRDEMLTLAYTTSPDPWLDHPDGVRMDVFSVAFRKPFYGIGDSLDVIYGNSSLNVPSTVLALGSPFGIIGKGDVLAVRWNHLFPRRGEYTGKLVFGFDWKYINTTCTPDARGTTSTCTPYTLRPLSATYSGQRQGAASQYAYNLGVAWNMPMGARYTHALSGKNDRYSFIAGRPVADAFTIVRYGGSYARIVDGWQLRAALSGQATLSGALPSAEQFGLAGATSVRGFDERAVSADTGHVVNLEAYTPNLAGMLNVPGNLNGVLFYDMGRGRNIGANNAPFNNVGLASAGVGLRYAMGKDLSFSLDAAEVLNQGPNNLDRRNNWGGHFKMMVAF